MFVLDHVIIMLTIELLITCIMIHIVHIIIAIVHLYYLVTIDYF